MESPHPDERPAKKRRFFTEDSSPAHPAPKRPASPPRSPPPAPNGHVKEGPSDNETAASIATDGFDVAMLQAVVGELNKPTLQKLKDVSGNNVERGALISWGST